MTPHKFNNSISNFNINISQLYVFKSRANRNNTLRTYSRSSLVELEHTNMSWGETGWVRGRKKRVEIQKTESLWAIKDDGDYYTRARGCPVFSSKRAFTADCCSLQGQTKAGKTFREGRTRRGQQMCPECMPKDDPEKQNGTCYCIAWPPLKRWH